ncbi:hypothetical protein CNR27_03700 [Luteimonas chenhongjianii]|uniref:Uncharacterized protein n=2 Tax=Luteimonas chenhongjianii TaxID=2006110 RepID=A0A290XBY1_9GAMM|nr:hypothetical protein CNR27_03700 [Luteimonas chenhongjianii]
MVAMQTRTEIDAMLARLEARLRELMAQTPHDAVLDAFSDEAAPLIEQVPEEHDAYVQERVHRMLVGAGLIPDESPTG